MADNEYERQRAERIAENKRKMEQLGLVESSRALRAGSGRGPGVSLEAGAEQAPRSKKRKPAQQQAQPEVLEPTRISRRLRGETAPGQAAAAAAACAEAAAAAEEVGRTRKGSSRRRLELDPLVLYAQPFSLAHQCITVWELGTVHRGAWAQRYWSSSGCLFHHAYPVGYRASKVVFGRSYDMRIEEGPTGPVFKVIDLKSGAVFSGESPTKPWTDVCIAHKTGQRISGPLFFGFSDPVTQRAIASQLYNEQELQAALQGDRLEATSLTPEEHAAKEFRGVEGIGETTAIVLSHTTALGGSKHAGLEPLQAWAQQSEDHAQQLFTFLCSSEEMPEATRRWPAWRQRLAPKVVHALSGRWFGQGPPPAEAAAAGAVPASGSGAAGGEPTQRPTTSQGQQRGEQRQQHAGAAAAAKQAPPQQAARAGKENRGRNQKAAAGGQTAAGLPGLQRSSKRERKPSSKLAAYLVEHD